MKKLLRSRDILMLMLSGVGDMMEEIKDPGGFMSAAYENMYGFIPYTYKKSNFVQMTNRALKTGDIEKVVKGDCIYLRLTTHGKKNVQRDFPIADLIKNWNKKWVIVLFDIPEEAKRVRDRFRIKLQNIGFGMLQQSVWITPLPIGKEILEFVESIDLGDFVFVLEVSHLLLGNPKELARKVWHLDKLEEEYLDIKNKLEVVNYPFTSVRGRGEKRMGNQRNSGKESNNEEIRGLKNRYVRFVASVPPLPFELLPESIKNISLKEVFKLF